MSMFAIIPASAIPAEDAALEVGEVVTAKRDVMLGFYSSAESAKDYAAEKQIGAGYLVVATDDGHEFKIVSK